jgi:hypothetical protein
LLIVAFEILEIAKAASAKGRHYFASKLLRDALDAVTREGAEAKVTISDLLLELSTSIFEQDD